MRRLVVMQYGPYPLFSRVIILLMRMDWFVDYYAGHRPNFAVWQTNIEVGLF